MSNWLRIISPYETPQFLQWLPWQGIQTPCLSGVSLLTHLLYRWIVRSFRARGVSDKPWAPIYYRSLEILGFIEKLQDSWTISLICPWFHQGGQAFVYLPTSSVTEHNKAFFVCPLYEGHTGVLLPVSHSLLKNGPLASWNDKCPSLSFDALMHAGLQHSLCQWLKKKKAYSGDSE